MQRFFTDTIESKFIKDLLSKTNIPLLPTKGSGDYIVKDFYYIFGDSIIRCLESGAIDNNAKFEVADKYQFGKEYLNITQRFISQYNYYDTNTHEQLGNYLRLVRDVLGIDLMPYYNCYSCRGIDDISIQKVNKTKYNEFDVVSYNEALYASKTNNNGTKPTNTTNWSSTFRDSLYKYKMYDVVKTTANSITSYYVNKSGEDTNVIPSSDTTNWTIGVTSIPSWSSSTTYNKFSLVIFWGSLLLVSKVDNNAYSPIFTNYWMLVGEVQGVEDWQQNSFQKYEIIKQSSNYYVSKVENNTTYDLTNMEYWKKVESIPNWKFDGYDFDIIKDTTSQYKKVVAPIRLNTTYTVCIDCSSPTIVSPIFYSNGIFFNNDDEIKDWCASQAQFVHGFSFKNPRTFRFEIDSSKEELLQEIEKDLYMVIQLPSSNTSSILVQEGDYTNLPRFNDEDENGRQVFSLVYSMETPSYEIPSKDLNRLLLSQLSLQRLNDGVSYAFSDRLIEYLLLNVIDSQDQIGENIEKAQDVVNLKQYTKGVWNDKLRMTLYNKFVEMFTNNKNKRVEFIDINGFVDKDTEYLLGV